MPGSQQFEIRFREPTPVGVRDAHAGGRARSAGGELSLGIDLPADRWLLATGGPAEGPAVLYWSELVVMLLIAWALARTRRTPLTLAAVDPAGHRFLDILVGRALLLVVAWLFALDWRARVGSAARPVRCSISRRSGSPF